MRRISFLIKQIRVCFCVYCGFLGLKQELAKRFGSPPPGIFCPLFLVRLTLPQNPALGTAGRREGRSLPRPWEWTSSHASVMFDFFSIKAELF